MRYDLRKQFRSFTYAFKGMRVTFFREQNLNFHLLAAVLVILLGAILGLERWEWVAVLIAIAQVISLELVNSAIESLTDLASPQWNPLAGRVKDIAAAAVLVSAIIAAAIGLIVFLPHLLPIS